MIFIVVEIKVVPVRFYHVLILPSFSAGPTYVYVDVRKGHEHFVIISQIKIIFMIIYYYKSCFETNHV